LSSTSRHPAGHGDDRTVVAVQLSMNKAGLSQQSAWSW
jgi:hypothetical protein